MKPSKRNVFVGLLKRMQEPRRFLCRLDCNREVDFVLA